MMQCSLGFVTKIWNVKKNCDAVLAEFWIQEHAQVELFYELQTFLRVAPAVLHQRLFLFTINIFAFTSIKYSVSFEKDKDGHKH